MSAVIVVPPNSPLQRTRCRSSARRFRASCFAVACVTPLARGGTAPLNGSDVSPTEVHTLVELHAIDIGSGSRAGLGKPQGFVERQIRGWTERWQHAKTGESPAIDARRSAGGPGSVLCYWSEAGDPEARRDSISAVTAQPGWWTRGQVLERYAARTGCDLSHIHFYEIFALFKVAVVLQQIFFRYWRGQTRDPRFADFDRRVVGLAQAALEVIENEK